MKNEGVEHVEFLFFVALGKEAVILFDSGIAQF